MMRDEIANLVYPVISYGLGLRDRLRAGRQPDLDNEQATLKALLGTEIESRRSAEVSGEWGDPSLMSMSRSGTMTQAKSAGSDQFLGIRYALVCWLDEMFIVDSPWAEMWNDKKLETALYSTNDRAWKFWEQARRAEARPGTDVLEVLFLCVMLGFRGELREDPDKLQAWVSSIRNRITKAQGQDWPAPPEQEPPMHVPPLHGREQFQRMVVVGGIVLLVCIPILAFFIVRALGS